MAAPSKHTFEEDFAKLVATVGDLFNPDPAPAELKSSPDSDQSRPVGNAYLPEFRHKHSGFEGSKFADDLQPEFDLPRFRKVFGDCRELIRTLRDLTPEWTPPWIERLL